MATRSTRSTTRNPGPTQPTSTRSTTRNPRPTQPTSTRSTTRNPRPTQPTSQRTSPVVIGRQRVVGNTSALNDFNEQIGPDADAFMFNVLDTIHDIFDRESKLTSVATKKLIDSGILSKEPVRNIWGKIDYMLNSVYGLSEYTLLWKSTNVKRTFVSLRPMYSMRNGRIELINNFSARSFLEYWSNKTRGYYYTDDSAEEVLTIHIEKMGMQETIRRLDIVGLDPELNNEPTIRRAVNANALNVLDTRIFGANRSANSSQDVKQIRSALKTVFEIVEFKSLDQIKHALMMAVFDVALQRRFTFHTEIGQQDKLIDLNDKVDTKTTKVVDTIFRQYDRLVCAVDATKGSLKGTRLLLTPAQLLDPSTTPVSMKVNLCLPFCTLTKSGSASSKNEILEITFDPGQVFNKQVTCVFYLKMFVSKSYKKSTARTDYATEVNDQLYNKLEIHAGQGRKNVLMVQNVDMKFIQTAVSVVAFTETKPKFRSVPKTALMLSAPPHSVSIVRATPRPVLENQTALISKQTFSGMSVNECIDHVDQASRGVTGVLKRYITQYYWDWKRMGDSFQISYLEALNRAFRAAGNEASVSRSTFPFVYFASQDILAICQAIGIKESKRPYDNLSFIFNTGGSNNWMIATNINHKAHQTYMNTRAGEIQASIRNRNREGLRTNARRILANLPPNTNRVSAIYGNLDATFNLSQNEKNRLASFLTHCNAYEDCRAISNSNSNTNGTQPSNNNSTQPSNNNSMESNSNNRSNEIRRKWKKRKRNNNIDRPVKVFRRKTKHSR